MKRFLCTVARTLLKSYHDLCLPQLAVPDLAESVKGADILIFVVPHQFIVRVCDTIKDHIKKDVIGMSLIKVM